MAVTPGRHTEESAPCPDLTLSALGRFSLPRLAQDCSSLVCCISLHSISSFSSSTFLPRSFAFADNDVATGRLHLDRLLLTLPLICDLLCESLNLLHCAFTPLAVSPVMRQCISLARSLSPKTLNNSLLLMRIFIHRERLTKESKKGK